MGILGAVSIAPRDADSASDDEGEDLSEVGGGRLVVTSPENGNHRAFCGGIGGRRAAIEQGPEYFGGPAVALMDRVSQ
jgi:hypothetical protein